MRNSWILGFCITLLLTVTFALCRGHYHLGYGRNRSPGSTLGPYAMTGFPADGQPIDTTVTGVASPDGGNVGFSPSLDHATVGNGWTDWSNGYMGDVYYTSGTSAVLSMPADTRAFYLYAEPRRYAPYSITATAQDGTFANQVINNTAGHSASQFGFYGTGGSTITSITVSTNDPGGFGVGEFGISTVPEPSTPALLAAVVMPPRLRVPNSARFGRGPREIPTAPSGSGLTFQLRQIAIGRHGTDYISAFFRAMGI